MADIFKNKDRPWYYNYALNTLEKMIPTSMWLVDFKDLPNSVWLYTCTIIYLGAFWSVFLYFCIDGYNSGVNDSYISYDKGMFTI
jgi:hypothetical protein